MIGKRNINTKEIGYLKGHSDWVTAIQTGRPQNENEETQLLITASRDRTIIIWKLNNESNISDFAQLIKQFTGHSQFISDLALYHDNNYLLSSSWDKTLKLWDLKNTQAISTFIQDGHNKEILSCTLSSDGRFILSSGADYEIKLWNTMGICKYTIKEQNHKDSISKIRFIPNSSGEKYFASVGWDGYLKIWSNQTFTIKSSIKAHEGIINALTISPKGNFIATGGKDKKINVFDFNSGIQKPVLSRNIENQVNCLAFHPQFDWIALGTEIGWQIWDIQNFEGKDSEIIAEGNFEREDKNFQDKYKKLKPEECYKITSIGWNNLGSRLFVGLSNGDLKVIEVSK